MIKNPQTMNDYFRILWRRKWYFLISLFIGSLIAGGGAYVLPDIYRSTTLIFVEPQKVSAEYVKPTTTDKVGDRLRTLTQQIMSRTRLERIRDEFGLYNGRESRSGIDRVLEKIPFVAGYLKFPPLNSSAAIGRMREDIDISVKGQKVFTIAYEGESPELAMKVTNRLASMLIEENLLDREQQAEGTSEFLESELENIRQVLEENEQKIREFKQRYMGELPQQLEANLRALDRFQLELKLTAEALNISENKREAMQQLLTGTVAQRVQPPSSSGTGLLRLRQLETELTMLKAEYQEGYPDIAILEREIQDIKDSQAKKALELSAQGDELGVGRTQDPLIQRLRGELGKSKIEIARLKGKRVNLEKQIRDFEERVENTPVREQQLTTIMRDYGNIQKNYQSLLGKRLEAKISENLEKRQKGEIFRVLDPADYPTGPSKPNRIFILVMGILLSAGVGGGMAFLRDWMDQSFSNEVELFEAFGVPVLGVIPHQSLIKRRRPISARRVRQGIYKRIQRQAGE